MAGKTAIVSQGELIFNKVSARYNPYSDMVIKELSFRIAPKEKIGIVGRTGAGKSSLIKMFWHCLKPTSGDIIVDGINIANVDLKDLRREIMVVSQDIALFEGTLRENIDPLCSSSNDEKLLNILKRLDFQHTGFEKDGLDMVIESDGGNLSQGEKQLICFSRTLVNKRKLIILDEATASIDVKTEESIQKAVEEEFVESTVLIIAHRIQTVMHCDRVMVLKNGVIEEFGKPREMIKQRNSYLKEIYDSSVVYL